MVLLKTRVSASYLVVLLLILGCGSAVGSGPKNAAVRNDEKSKEQRFLDELDKFDSFFDVDTAAGGERNHPGGGYPAPSNPPYGAYFPGDYGDGMMSMPTHKPSPTQTPPPVMTPTPLPTLPPPPTSPPTLPTTPRPTSGPVARPTVPPYPAPTLKPTRRPLHPPSLQPHILHGLLSLIRLHRLLSRTHLHRLLLQQQPL